MRDEQAWRAHVIDAELQALSDVAVAGAATVSVRISKDGASGLAIAMSRAALAEGYAVARASLAESSLHTLDEIVRALANGVRTEALGARRAGVIALLDAFFEEHGKRAKERFEERADESGLSGDLRTLARS